MNLPLAAKFLAAMLSAVFLHSSRDSHQIPRTSQPTIRPHYSSGPSLARRPEVIAERARTKAKWERQVALYNEAKALANRSDFKAAEEGFKKILQDQETIDRISPQICYGSLLVRLNRPSDAMDLVKPLVLDNGPTCMFEALQVFEAALNKLGDRNGIAQLRDEIRDKPLNGFSLRHYNEQGLTDQQAIDYVAAGRAMAQRNLAEAEKLLRSIAAQNTVSDLPYYQLNELLADQRRGKDASALLESRYLGSNPETRAKMRKRYALDFKRLDARIKP